MPDPLLKGQVYVIRSFETRYQKVGEVGIRLVGMDGGTVKGWEHLGEAAWSIFRFRKLSDIQQENKLLWRMMNSLKESARIAERFMPKL